MSVVVFPEQISFIPSIQKNNKRHRITIKNLGNMTIKIIINPPKSNCFTMTDAKGKIINGSHRINLTSESSEFIFIQKNSSVGLVPDDFIVIESPEKSTKVSLKPAVSMITADELEAVVKRSGQKQQNDALNTKLSTVDKAQKQSENVLLSDEDENVREIPSRSSFKRLNSGREEKAKLKEEDLLFVENDFLDKNDDQQDFDTHSQINEKKIDDTNNGDSASVGSSKKKSSLPSSHPNKDQDTKKSAIPKKIKHSEFNSEADVLSQSLKLKFTTAEEDESDPRVLSARKQQTFIPWYDDDAFLGVETPEFEFELMLTKEGEDPIFCIDGDYYDSSGRLLTVQQGKQEIVFLTDQNKKKDKDLLYDI